MRKLSKNQEDKLNKRKIKNSIFAILAIVSIVFFIGYILFLSKDIPNSSPNVETTRVTTQETNVESYSNESEEEIETVSEEELEAQRLRELFPKNYNETGTITEFRDPFENLEVSEQEKTRIYAILPKLLQSKVDRYPETENTVYQYEKYKDIKEIINIDDDYEAVTRYESGYKLPYFNQWDVRWAFKEIDDGIFGVSGCGPTVLSSIYVGLTGDTSINPYKMGEMALVAGVYDGKDGSIHTMFTEFVSVLGLKGEYSYPSLEDIKYHIDNDEIVVANVKENGIGDFTTGGHYIIITGYTEDNQLSLYDVNSYVNTNKLWDYQRVLDQTGDIFVLSLAE